MTPHSTRPRRDREEALEQSLAHEARVMGRLARFAREHHITGEEARRFLARQRASLQRQRQAALLAEAGEAGGQLPLLPSRTLALPHVFLGCPGCYEFRAITHLPYQTPCCGYRFFEEGPAHG
jgi:hypothetical protein